MVSIPWPWKVVAEEDGTFVVEGKTSELWRLWSAARINGSRDFLRIGWMFVSGNINIGGKQTQVFFPAASAPVRLRRPRSPFPGSRGSTEYQIVADADLAVPESIFPDHKIRERLNEDLDTLVESAFPLDSSIMSWELGKKFVERVCFEAGLPAPVQVAKTTTPVQPTDGELTVHTGLAVYTSRDRSAINLQSTLLSWIRARPNATALAALYVDETNDPIPDLTGAVANSLPLNTAQQQAVLMARELPISVLSGPPGTGKTHTAVAVAVDQVARGNSVLIAAQSDDAIDAVESLLSRHSSPRHVRFGSRTSRRRVSAELSEGLRADAAATAPDAAAKLEAIEADVARNEQAVRRRLETEADFSRSLELRSRNSWCLADAPLLGQVLESTDRMAAVCRLLEQRSVGGLFGSWRRAWTHRRLASMLGLDMTQIDRVAEPVQHLIDAERAVRAGQATAALSIEAAFDAMEESSARARISFGQHLEALRSGRSWSAGASRSIALLATALRSGPAARRRALQDIQIDAGLEALPLWIGTLTDIDDVLPMRAGMFDVVIVDESSQVNQVRAATSLARGKRAVVIGDPRQLRHVSFVGDEAMREAADLTRRATQLQDIAPKLRAKGAEEAVAMFLTSDAVAPTSLTSLWSDRAARRFCDRLVELRAARELTGRDTFRLYGL